MPPKASTSSKDGGKEKGKPKDEGPTLQEFVDAVRAGSVTTPDGKLVKRGDALLKVWSVALLGEDQREELFKAGAAPVLQQMLDKGEAEERHAAIGALAALAQSEKHYTEVINSKVIGAAATLLATEHDRGKLPATQLLCFCASRAEFSNRVADAALPAIVDVIKSDGLPGWGQMRAAQRAAATALKHLIENVEGEAPEAKMMRRVQVVSMGVVPPLIRMVSYLPRLPPPAVVPAPPPVIGKSKKAAKGKKKESVMPLGGKDAAATVAAACLRFLALTPAFIDELLGSGHLPDLAAALLVASDEQAAYLCGVLWEVSAEEVVARELVAADAVPALLHVISKNMANAKSGKKGGKKAAEGKDAKEKKKGAEAAPPEPPCFPDIAVCNAAGALQHLTFLDAAKQAFAAAGGAPILTGCLKLSNPQTYENVTGALWNVGLDVRNNLMLMAAGAPEFLAMPVPERWLTRGSSSGQEPAAVPDEDADPGSTFMTQTAGMASLRVS